MRWRNGCMRRRRRRQCINLSLPRVKKSGTPDEARERRPAGRLWRENWVTCTPTTLFARACASRFEFFLTRHYFFVPPHNNNNDDNFLSAVRSRGVLYRLKTCGYIHTYETLLRSESACRTDRGKKPCVFCDPFRSDPFTVPAGVRSRARAHNTQTHTLAVPTRRGRGTATELLHTAVTRRPYQTERYRATAATKCFRSPRASPPRSAVVRIAVGPSPFPPLHRSVRRFYEFHVNFAYEFEYNQLVRLILNRPT